LVGKALAGDRRQFCDNSRWDNQANKKRGFQVKKSRSKNVSGISAMTLPTVQSGLQAHDSDYVAPKPPKRAHEDEEGLSMTRICGQSITDWKRSRRNARKEVEKERVMIVE
jgi:hypothetical protein